jgi:hypothetical protein
MATFDWRRFEKELKRECLRALGEDLRPRLDASPVYAVALFGVDRELDGVLALPLLGASTAKTGAAAAKDGFWGARWSPPDWTYQVSLSDSVGGRLEQELTAEATRGSERQWRRTEARYFEVLLKVTKALKRRAEETLTVSDAFVTFWHDEEGGLELARKTIQKERFEQLFAPRLKARRAPSRSRPKSPEARAELLVAQLVASGGDPESAGSAEDAERELISLGRPAVKALAAAVADEEQGWQAAHALGMIGHSTPAALEALRARVGDNDWFAAALGYLHDDEWLLANAPDNAVVTALTVTLQAWRRVPLDYHRLEAFLDRAGKKARALAEEELAPGRSYLDIAGDDVPEALRGLSSKHAVVRWHAASVLGERRLGVAAGKRILPALQRALSDSHPVVRRLAVLSILAWRSAAKPYLKAVDALKRDPDEAVRDAATRD